MSIEEVELAIQTISQKIKEKRQFAKKLSMEADRVESKASKLNEQALTEVVLSESKDNQQKASEIARVAAEDKIEASRLKTEVSQKRSESQGLDVEANKLQQDLSALKKLSRDAKAALGRAENTARRLMS